MTHTLSSSGAARRELPGGPVGARTAFTLIELLVVIAIIALLVSILLPSLARAKELARRVKCLSGVRNMVTAAEQYAGEYGDSYPFARYQYPPNSGSEFSVLGWDFSRRVGGAIVPGLLWERGERLEIQQCPSFDGAANAPGEKYTGYNYNTSYIGRGTGEAIVDPAKLDDVADPAGTALFGDGEFSSGANKHMRAPLMDPAADWSFSGRYAGTQGFRHAGATNVSFCDGHAVYTTERFTNIYPDYDAPKIADGTGFLSEDNSLYDLE